MSNEKIYIVKVGGNLIEDEDQLEEFLKSFCQLPGHKILVHGGGKVATEIAASLGFHSTMIEGRRVTDSNMLKVVTMVYGGLVNKSIVSKLQSYSTNAIGLTGADGNLITSLKRAPKNGLDFGWVGDPVSINIDFLQSLLDHQLVPVIAPLTHDARGHMLNTNADTMANVIAMSLSQNYQTHLIYVFELPGVLADPTNPESVIRDLDPGSYAQFKQKEIISGGMIPKLDNAFQAIDGGVSSVKILNIQALIHLNDQDYDTYTTIHK